MTDNILKNNQAFTLVEILVATFVLALMVFAVSGVYLAFNSSQIRTNASQQLLNDSQYAIDIMSNEIRNSLIVAFPGDINCDGVLEPAVGGGVEDCIMLERSDGQAVAFIRHNSLGGLYEIYYLLLDCVSDYSSCQPVDLDFGDAVLILSPEINNINVVDMNFDITPQFNPYISGGPNYQPKVTISMHTAYNSGNRIENVSHFFQTTVSSRVYRR